MSLYLKNHSPSPTTSHLMFSSLTQHMVQLSTRESSLPTLRALISFVLSHLAKISRSDSVSLALQFTRKEYGLAILTSE